MTEQEQQIAIGEACGVCIPDWRYNGAGHYCTKCGRVDYDAIGKAKHPPEPDYLHDLNAMHEAENLRGLNPVDYIEKLAKIVNAEMAEGWSGLNDVFLVRHATATQCAEAFLRTIGKWKE